MRALIVPKAVNLQWRDLVDCGDDYDYDFREFLLHEKYAALSDVDAGYELGVGVYLALAQLILD